MREEIFEALKTETVTALSGISITTLEAIIANLTSGEKIANSPQRIATWVKILARTKNCDCLFPNGKPERENLFEVAKELDNLSEIIGEKFSSFAEVAQFLQESDSPQNGYEIALWHELAKLENECTTELSANALIGKNSAIEYALQKAELNFDNIVVAINPDAPALLSRFLKTAQKHANVFILIGAEEHMQNAFDEVGRPLAKYFENATVDISAKNTFIFSSVKEEADSVASLASCYAENAKNILGISCEQTENADIFKASFAEKDISAKIPENKKFLKSALFKLIKLAANHRENDSFIDFSRAFENPLISFWVTEKFNAPISKILEIMDDIREELVPSSTTSLVANLRERNDVERFELVNFVFECLSEISSNSPEAVVKQSEKIIENLAKSTDSLAFINFETQALDSLKNRAKEISEAFTIFRLSCAEVSELFISALQKSGSNDDDFSNSVLLNNWIEIFWSRKPHLLLCDMNDGIVPLAERENQFITDSLKCRLGLKNSSQRQARDTYMLSQLLRTRPDATQILFSVKDASEAPTIPSRILTQSDNLPERISFLFQEPQSAKLELSAPTLLALKLDKTIKPDFSMSAYKFNTYLNSPIDFYIKYILKAREIEPDKSEMDDTQFGNLFHLIMHKFALSNVKNSTDEQQITAFFNEQLNIVSQQEFGSDISAQLRVQLFTLRQKLNAVAKVQANHAKEGWQIWGHPERSFKFEIASTPVTGVIDRIDFNEKLGKYLIVDYKTYKSTSPKITQETHYEKLDEKGNPIWLNLQMPLYVLAMRSILPDCACAYFISPQDTTETAIDIWTISEEILSSAKTKMEEIVADILASKFLTDVAPKYPICPNTFALSTKTLLTLADK